MSDRLQELSAERRELIRRRLGGRGMNARPGRAGAAAPPLAPVPRGECPAASYSQERLWFLEQLMPGTIAYNAPATFLVEGPLDAGLLRRALGAVASRHEVLRTRYAATGGEPYQVIDPPVAEVPVPVTDLSGDDDPVGRAHRLARAVGETPFDLTAGPLFRAELLRLAADRHVLVLAFHHILFDAWSLGIFKQEVSDAYAAYVAGSRPRWDDLPVQYADFAAWQREWLTGETLARELTYWRRRLAGAPPALELPADRPRPPLPSFRGGIHDFTIPAEVVAGLRDLGRRHGATLFMVLLAAYQAVLSRHTGSPDIVVAAPTAGRPRPELEGLIGFFVNSLPLRTDLSDDPEFGALVDRVREGVLEAFAHQDVPFERVVEGLAPARDLSRNPVVQVWMYLLDGEFAETSDGALRLEGAATEPFGENIVTTRFDLEMHLVARPDGSVAAKAVYAADLFEPATMRRFVGHLVNFLAGVAADPSARVSRVELMDPAERRRVLEEWNDTGTAPPPELTVPQWFERQVAATPEAAALVCDDEQLTYAELNARANRMARGLRARGIGPESVVALCLRRGVDLPVAMLAVLKSGGAYLPVDPDFPTERLARMFADADTALVLTEEELRERLPDGTPTLCVEGLGDGLDDGDLPAYAGPDNLLYVYFTSGSTGRPKGVAMPHRPILHVLEWHRRRLTERPVALAYFPVTSDASFYEMATAWVAGGTVVLAGEDAQIDVARLVDLLDRHAVTKVIMPNVALDQLLEHVRERPGTLAALREVVATGDRLKIGPAAREVYRRLAGVLLDNHYGPTETHAVTAEALTGDPRTWPAVPPIGPPVSYARAYLLDAAMNPVLPGVTGELYVGGDALARGYTGRPDQTAERFVPDPFATTPGARLYRTGDLARWRPDGALDYLGRVDHQVKIRGYRIELAEIEAALVAHPAVREAVVVASGGDDAGGTEPALTGYVVCDGAAPDDGELRAHLAATLPDYMVPATFVVLESFPLTGTGKVDRNRLPAPEPRYRRTDPPRSQEEQAIAAVWAGVFGLERVGRDDDFFELGGHSLLATRVNARLREAFGVDLPLRALFEHRTVAALARLIVGVREAADAPPRAGDRGERPPLSFAQQRLWFLDQLIPESAAYNISGAYRFTGPLEAVRVEAALRAVLKRHEVLRTRYAVADGEPYQLVDPVDRFHLEMADLSDRPDPEAEARDLARADGEAAFDLAEGPLFRARLLRLGAEDHVLLVAFHHSVFDASSIRVFHRDFAAAYVAPEPDTEPGAPVQYADFAAWQRRWLTGEVLDRQLAYWRGRMAGAPPVLDLPTDHPRPAVLSFRGGVVEFTVPPDVVAGLRRIGRAEGATLFMVMLAAYQAVLARHTGTPDVVVGCPAAGRTRAELEDMVGFFVNTLPMRTDLSGDPTMEELVARVRETVLEGLAHQDVPFERLVEELAPPRDLSRNPVVQTWFDLFAVEETEFRLGQATAERFDPGATVTRFDVAIQMEQVDRAVTARLTYATDLFEHSSMERLVGHFVNFLAEVATDPTAPVARVELMPPAERHEVLNEWNDVGVPAPAAPTATEWFERRVASTPDAIALVHGTRRLTFADLNLRANQLARYLRRRGVRPGHVVGVCLRRGVHMPVAMLGVLKSGAAYMPVDPSLSVDRMTGMFADTGASLVLSRPDLRDRLPAGPEVVDVEGLGAQERGGDLRQAADPDDMLYVYFTSGSTGRPKGVAMPHRSFTNVCAWQVARCPDPLTTVQFAPLGFDISIQETFAAWLAGGTVALIDEDDRIDPRRLADVLREAGVQRWHCPPLVLEHLARAVDAGAEPPPLVEIIPAGEQLQLTPELRALLRRRADAGARPVLDNQYGPTEAHGVAAYRMTDDQDAWPDAPPIGVPLAGSRLYVLDDRLDPVPPGVPGELCVAGVQLAFGYLRRPDLTAAAFVPNPLAKEPGERLYRTGDLVRWRADGALEFLGRNDHQVKIRGYRIEPGEIESALTADPQVAEAAVVPVTVGGDRRLAAYVVPAGQDEPDPTRLRARLAATLPDYMVPSYVVGLARLPLTSNGKLDHKALPEPMHGRSGAAGGTPPRTRTEKALHDIWAGALGIDAIGVHEDFFDLGGHSLLATRVNNRLREVCGVELPIRALFEHRTIEALARLVDGDTGALDPSPDLRVVLDSDITFEPVQDTSELRHILLTGATGFLGGHLLAELLDRTRATVTCLVRAGDTATARKRVEARLAAIGRWGPRFAARLHLVPVDLAAPRLGLDADAFARLARKLDAIYHCAAEVSALRTYAQLEPVNVGATRELLRLASLAGAPRFHLVSTAAVAQLGDDPAAVAAAGGYIRSKWAAERLVALARERGLPAVAYRPARVTGDSRTGRYETDDALVRFIRGCLEAGVAPRGDFEDLWTPVDHTARTIAALSLASTEPGEPGDRDELGATGGPGGFGEVGVHVLPADRVPVGAVWERLNAGAPRLRMVGFEAWRAAIRAAGPDNPAYWIADGSSDAPDGDAGAARPLYGDGAPVDLAAGTAAAERAGVPAPRVDDDLIGRYLDDLMARGLLPGPDRPGADRAAEG